MPPTAAARATISGVGALEAVRRNVFTPGVSGAGVVFVHVKLK